MPARQHRAVCRFLCAGTAAALILSCATAKGFITVSAGVRQPMYISPQNADGVQDSVVVPLAIASTGDITVTGYRFTVSNAAGRLVWFSEASAPRPALPTAKKAAATGFHTPRALTWDGRDRSGRFVVDGQYTGLLEVWDWFGNRGRSPDLLIVVDNTPPSLTLMAPYSTFSPNEVGRQDEVVIYQRDSSTEDSWHGAIIDPTGLPLRRYTWSGSPPDLVWDGTEESGKQAPDGTYAYEVHCTDRAGNPFAAGLDGLVLDTRPSLVALSVSPSAFSPNGDGIKDGVAFRLYVVSPEHAAEWTLDVTGENGATTRIAEGTGTPPRAQEFDGRGHDGVILPDGWYFGRLTVLHDNHQLSQAASERFVLDTVPPKIGSLSADTLSFSPDGDGDRDGVRIRQSTSTENLWEGRITDVRDAVVFRWYWFGNPAELLWDGRSDDGKLLPNGRYVYTLCCQDDAGNGASARVGPVSIEARPGPMGLTLQHIAFSPNGDGRKDTIGLYPTVARTEGIDGWEIDTLDADGTCRRSMVGKGRPPPSLEFDGRDDFGRLLPDGTYRSVLRVSYQSGDTLRTTSPQFTVDTSAPYLTVNAKYRLFSPNDDGRKDALPIYQSGSVEQTWTHSIAGSDGAFVLNRETHGRPRTLTWDGRDQDGRVVPDGRYDYRVSCTDDAGNSSSVTVAGIAVDAVSPTVAIAASLRAFSPNDDGLMDAVAFALLPSTTSGIAAWHSTIYDGGLTPRRRLGGEGGPPSRIDWAGDAEDGSVTEGDYYADVVVEYAKGDVCASRTDRPVALDLTPPELVADLGPLPFSPDGDGMNDLLRIDLAVTDASGVGDWSVNILDPMGEPFKLVTGTGSPDAAISWDGRATNGELVQSAEDYRLVISASDSAGNRAATERMIPVDVLVLRDGDRLKIVIASIYFKPFTADFTDAAAIGEAEVERNLRTLDRLAEILKKYPDYRIKLEGHAVRVYWYDAALGQAEERETLVPLSQQRAEAARRALADRGVPAERMSTEGFGGSQPVVPHSDLANHWKNRRVEFLLRR